MGKLYARWQKNRVQRALQERRVVLLEGSRQSGKTTLLKMLADGGVIYRTLDEKGMLEAANDDPAGFVQHGDSLMIIDEVQRSPDLLLAIKKDVDENPTWGRFLLAGSANIQSIPTVRESLAGRISKVRLHPLALGEIKNRMPNSIIRAFDGAFEISDKLIGKDAYIKLALRGGYPEALQLATGAPSRRWYKDYLTALVDRDLKDIAKVTNRDGLFKLVVVLAAWSSKAIDIASIGSSLGLARLTIEGYINALESLYLVSRLRAWHKTEYDRVNKKDKLFMADTGFMASILNWHFDDVQFNSDLSGKLIETFVFNQLTAVLDAQDESYYLYYYRDRDGREVDFIVENEKGSLVGIEVKSGSAVTKDSFAHLRWFKEHMAKQRAFTGIVLYAGEHVLPFGKDMWAVPICALWG